MICKVCWFRSIYGSGKAGKIKLHSYKSAARAALDPYSPILIHCFMETLVTGDTTLANHCTRLAYILDDCSSLSRFIALSDAALAYH